MHDKQRDVFGMWYLSMSSHVLSPNPEPIVQGFKRIGHPTLVANAESKKGYQWTKSSLGVLDLNTPPQSEVVHMGRVNTEGVSIVDQPDDPNPKRRDKAIFWEYKVTPRGERIISNGPEGAWASGIIVTATPSFWVTEFSSITLASEAVTSDTRSATGKSRRNTPRRHRSRDTRRDGWVTLNLPFVGGPVTTKQIVVRSHLGVTQATTDRQYQRLHRRCECHAAG